MGWDGRVVLEGIFEGKDSRNQRKEEQHQHRARTGKLTENIGKDIGFSYDDFTRGGMLSYCIESCTSFVSVSLRDDVIST